MAYTAYTTHTPHHDYHADIDSKLVAPLLSGEAYHTSIQEFKPLRESSFIARYDEFGLPKDLQNGYYNEYNVILKPYLIGFTFHYDSKYLENLRLLFANMCNKIYCDAKAIRAIKDLRTFDMSCAVFGDFDLEYIEREGWYGIKQFYLDTFQTIPLEYSRTLAQKLNRLESYLYFSFVDSTQKPIISVYSDFRDYSLDYYNTAMPRKISRLVVNTKRATFATYQVDPLSPMALSYRLRVFFLVREKPEENNYAFVVFLSDEEANNIAHINMHAKAESS